MSNPGQRATVVPRTQSPVLTGLNVSYAIMKVPGTKYVWSVIQRTATIQDNVKGIQYSTWEAIEGFERVTHAVAFNEVIRLKMEQRAGRI